ncbi:CDP-alcohol phosphatidyltransferase family protein [Trujillonella humicola]|uniref:CDP-alcohol phosphatidyltransferase family protein n=1 Tax=Trujillonella humicola TaxID=3383699 RepID=UPI0039069AEA
MSTSPSSEQPAAAAAAGPAGGDGAGPPVSPGLRLAGAAVHAYTALGTVVGFAIVIAAIEGEVEAALWLGLAALFIDGTDGMLARRARVKQTMPWFDGALLDNIVDYLTYVFAPVVLLWTTGHLPEGPPGWLLAALPLLASSYQFCRVDAKTDDHTFLGFPSYWNVVAFYVIVLDASEPVVAVVLIVLSVLVFVPIRFLYPSRSGVLRTLSLALSAVWAVTYAVLLVQYPDPHPLVVAASLAYVVYYWGVSLWMTARAASRRREERTPA